MSCLAFGSLRLAVWGIESYKTELESKLTELLATPIQIGTLRAHLHGINPELILKNIRIRSAADLHYQTPIALQEIHVSLNLWQALKIQQLIPATWISLVGAKFSVIYRENGELAIVGLQSNSEQPLWLLQGRHYELLHSQITWVDERKQRAGRVFEDVDVIIKNNPVTQLHQVSIMSRLPQIYGEKLHFIAKFTGNAFAVRDLNGEFFAEGQAVQLAPLLKSVLPEKLSLLKGTSDFKIWGNFTESSFTALTAEISANNLRLQREDGKKFVLKQASTRWQWTQHTHDWKLVVAELQLATREKNWSTAPFMLRSAHKISESATVAIQQLDLEEVNFLAQFFLPLAHNVPEWFTKLHLHGQLSNVTASMNTQTQQVAFRGHFQELAITHPEIQLENLAGDFNGTQQQAILNLKSQPTPFILPALFKQPLRLTQLRGQFQWQQLVDGWQLSSSNLQIATPDIRTAHQFQFHYPETKPAFMDLQTAFADLKDISCIKNYFPTFMNPVVAANLSQLLLAGEVKHGNLLFYGNLRDFPFRQQQGVFELAFKGENALLKTDANWPLLEHFAADLFFHNESLDIDITHVQGRKVIAESGKLSIASLENSEQLNLQLKINTPINDGLDFLQHTTLSSRIAPIQQHLAFAGDAQIDLDLQLPLIDSAKTAVKGSLLVNNAHIDVLPIALPIENASSLVNFTQDGFDSVWAKADVLNYPAQAKLHQDAEGLQIHVDSTIAIETLHDYFKLPVQQFALGSSDYHLFLDFPMAANTKATAQLTSDLDGISLNLPDSLAKNAQEKKTFALQTILDKNALLPVKLTYDQQFTAQLLLEKANKNVYAGNILLGAGEVALPEKTGIDLTIKQTNFSPLAWFNLFKAYQEPKDLPGFKNLEGLNSEGLAIHEINLHAENLQFSQHALGRMDLELQHQENHWQGILKSTLANGKIAILQQGQQLAKVDLNLDFIDLSRLADLHLTPEKNSPATVANTLSEKLLPLFTLQSKKVLLRAVDLGELQLESERIADGIQISRFNLGNQAHHLNLSGTWRFVNQQESSQLKGEWQSAHFGDLLARLDFSHDLKETEADIHFNLNWQNAPYLFNLADLNGTVDIQLDEGRISSIEPGFGRLLGMLAVEQWTKRLQLDFRDIYLAGLSFNRIGGHFALQKGKATTEDLIVDAIAAKISLTGELDLARQTQALQVVVLPKSSDALPIAGTIVDHVATLITQVLTGDDEDGFYLRSKYQVSGQWDDPNVTPLYAQNGLLQKIAHTLTDFSWMSQLPQDK